MASREFTAQFGGRCGNECGTRISPGDQVRYDEDDTLVHADCSPAAPARPEGKPCTSCWLVHAGECP